MIKFRAWERNLEEIIPVHDIDFDRKMINTNSAWRMFDEIELMQWTGLKDKNGNEIYESDIVQLKGCKPYEIAWDDINAQFYLKRGSYGALDLNCDLHEYEIVGNKFEMPDWDF